MNRIVIGIDQSYADSGITISYNGKVKTVLDCQSESLEDNSSKRKALYNILLRVFDKVSRKASCESSEVYVIIERIRLQSQGFLNINYIKSIGALNALIVDLANEYNFPVYSVDTRAWKSAIIGNSKGMSNKYGINEKKWPTILWCIKNGYEDKILMKVSKRKKKGIVKYINGEPYTYNDNRADSICISLYGFIPKSQQLLKEEH